MRTGAESGLGRVWRLLRSPYVLIPVAMLLFALNYVFARLLRAEVTPVGINFWRLVVALALLLPLCGTPLWRARRVLLREWRLLGLLALFGVALFYTLMYLALESTTAINATTVHMSTPMVIVAISWLLHRDRITPRQGLGIGISLVGACLIITRGDPSRLLAMALNPGDVWAVLSIPTWALYTVLLKRRPPDLPPMVLMAAISAIGLVMLAPFFLAETLAGEGMPLTWSTVLMVAYVGIFVSVVALVLWTVAVPAVGPNKAGLFVHMNPMFTTILAILFLGEALHGYHVLAIALIVGGIWLASTARLPVPEPATESVTESS
jgi:drug/metabolite transporter (DMT)-like permease